jgi:hypothetical protein
MTQPAVALSDFALAIEAGIFAWLIYINRGFRGGVASRDPSRNDSSARGRRQALRRWFVMFFCAAAAASLIGGAVHGFFLDPMTFAARALWPATMIAVGAAAWAAWGIGAEIALSRASARLFARVATIEIVVYAVAVVLGMRSFRAAIINYLPATVFLLAAFTLAYVRRRISENTQRDFTNAANREALNPEALNPEALNTASDHEGDRDTSYLLGALAMVVTLLAAALQQSKIAIAPLGLTHNVIYHLVQGAGLLLLFLSARPLVSP